MEPKYFICDTDTHIDFGDIKYSGAPVDVELIFCWLLFFMFFGQKNFVGDIFRMLTHMVSIGGERETKRILREALL